MRNTELTSYCHQPEEFGKGPKEMPWVLPPPRGLLAGLHLGREILEAPGGTLGQNDWPRTTWKLTPSP